MAKKDMSYRNPKKHRGINANGSNQSGGGGTGKTKGQGSIPKGRKTPSAKY